MKRILLLVISHALVGFAGFALGIYLLPILTAPGAPSAAEVAAVMDQAKFSGDFRRDLKGSDFLHWGEGSVSITPRQIVHQGRLAPGPDYKLYLVNEFVEHEDEFVPVKATAQLIGDVKTFEGFLLDVPEGVDVSDYTTVLIWCESFSEFITAAKYR